MRPTEQTRKFRVEPPVLPPLPKANRETDGYGSPSTAAAQNSFQDRNWAPLMRILPAGRFLMGAPESERGRSLSEGPVREVTIRKAFAIGVYPVTCREFAAYANSVGFKDRGALRWTGFEMEQIPDASWDEPGFFQTDNHPVTCISWDDAAAYAAWLSHATGRDYRLPTESEWEYAARAGTTSAYRWGNAMLNGLAHYDRSYDATGEGATGECSSGTIAVDALPPNPWGLYQLLGNVWESCEDTWHENYLAAPSDGTAWTSGRHDRRIVRGGSWSADPDVVRCAQRRWISAARRMVNVGFRLALTIS